jgi:hypothetical protein
MAGCKAFRPARVPATELPYAEIDTRISTKSWLAR